MTARKTKKGKRSPVDGIERAAKRAAQKAAGAFDGRYRPRVVKSRKRYVRKPKHRKAADGAE